MNVGRTRSFLVFVALISALLVAAIVYSAITIQKPNVTKPPANRLSVDVVTGATKNQVYKKPVYVEAIPNGAYKIIVHLYEKDIHPGIERKKLEVIYDTMEDTIDVDIKMGDFDSFIDEHDRVVFIFTCELSRNNFNVDKYATMKYVSENINKWCKQIDRFMAFKIK